MGSNPTAVIDIFCDMPFEIEVTNGPYPRYCELHSLDVLFVCFFARGFDLRWTRRKQSRPITRCTSKSSGGAQQKDNAMLLLNPKTVWPSGLRRWLQAPVRKGVGSNPTAVINISCGPLVEIEVIIRSCPRYGELHSVNLRNCEFHGSI